MPRTPPLLELFRLESETTTPTSCPIAGLARTASPLGGAHTSYGISPAVIRSAVPASFLLWRPWYHQPVPVFAKQKLSLSHSRSRFFLFFSCGFLFLCGPPSSRADSFEEAARSLAHKVCASPHQQFVRINWQESAQASGWITGPQKKAFLSQLSACGMALSENPAAPLLSVSLQRTATKMLLIAGPADSLDSREIHMVEVPREALSVSTEFAPAPRLRRELLWQQEKPINSGIEWNDGSTHQRFLFLLSQGFLIRLRLEHDSWSAVDSTELPARGPRSRLGDGTFVSYEQQTKAGILLDGKWCEIEVGERVSFACKEAGVGEKTVSVSSACDETRQILATGEGDDTQTDRITLIAPETMATALLRDEIDSRSVDLPGPVLDLSGGQDSKAAAAVVRNLSTGNYEVYRITTVCGN